MDTQVPQQQEKKTASNARARVRHHRLFDRGPAVPRRHTRLCPVPGRSSQSACSKGGTRFLSRRHPYLQGAEQGTRTRPRRRTPRCRLAPPPLNLPHKKRGSFPSSVRGEHGKGTPVGVCAPCLLKAWGRPDGWPAPAPLRAWRPCPCRSQGSRYFRYFTSYISPRAPFSFDPRLKAESHPQHGATAPNKEPGQRRSPRTHTRRYPAGRDPQARWRRRPWVRKPVGLCAGNRAEGAEARPLGRAAAAGAPLGGVAKTLGPSGPTWRGFT